MEPVGEAAFAAVMEAFAPFEPLPTIAVGVSGGPDSMALALLLDRRVRPKGGRVIALTVDHGLRPDSAAEAEQVGRWLAARSIAHRVLAWTGEKPCSRLQETARTARYALLAAACQAHGILHLAVAHHADDQAETVLFRRDRGSLDEGLAGMAAERSLGPVRLIRPLLGWPKAALIATCAAFGQDFASDPSNRAERFARTDLRRRLAGDDAGHEVLLTQATGSARRRIARSEAVAALLAAAAEIRPDGAVIFDRAVFCGATPALRRAALAAAVRAIGGGRHAPAALAVAALDREIAAASFSGAALGGCVIRPWRERLLVCREPGRIARPVPLDGTGWHEWDRRFRLRVAEPAFEPGPLTVGALGAADFARLRKICRTALPAVIGAGLPAVRAGERLLAVPSLGWCADGAPIVEQRFQPPWPVSPERFTVVNRGPDIMFGRGDEGPALPADSDPR